MILGNRYDLEILNQFYFCGKRVKTKSQKFGGLIPKFVEGPFYPSHPEQG